MYIKSINSFSAKIIGVLCIGLTLGLLFGLGSSVSNIFSHDYFNANLYNLIVFDIQKNITRYSILFPLILVAAYLLFSLVKKLFELKPLQLYKLGPKRSNTLIFLINILLLYIIACTVFYSDIWLTLKVLSRNAFFHSFVNDNSKKLFILFAVFYASSLSLLIFAAYIFSKFNLVESVNQRLANLTRSNKIRTAGLVAATFLVAVNIATFFYINNNKPVTPNILLITIDTLRADHLGIYGYKRDTSPNIDELANKGVLFENAYSQAPWTYPSMASMHTSLYPSQLGIKRFESRMDDKLVTIAEYLKNNFYATYAIVSNMVVSDVFGFKQGYDKFEKTSGTNEAEITSQIVTERTIEFIKNNKDNKFFVWAHYMDPHCHFNDHDEFDYATGYSGSLPGDLSTVRLNKIKDSLDVNDINHIKDVYDEEISYTDKYIGILIESLSELGIDDNTIIILTADHGEEFMERTRFGHAMTLYQELVKVPLIIYNPMEPKSFGKKVAENVEVRYIAKTILDLTEVTDSSMQGHNLLEVDRINLSDDIIYTELVGGSQTAIYLDQWKLIAKKDENSVELFNLEDDSLEINDLSNLDNVDHSGLIETLKVKLANHNNLEKTESDKLVLTKDDINKLKALGYLQ